MPPQKVSIAIHLGIDTKTSPVLISAPFVDLDVGDKFEDNDGVAHAAHDGGDDATVQGVYDEDRSNQCGDQVEAMKDTR